MFSKIKRIISCLKKLKIRLKIDKLGYHYAPNFNKTKIFPSVLCSQILKKCAIFKRKDAALEKDCYQKIPEKNLLKV